MPAITDVRNSFLSAIPLAMIDGWRDRLRAAVEASGKTARAISLEANCAHGYVHGIIHENKSATIEKLDAICDVLNVPLYKIVYGEAYPAQVQEVLDLWRSAPPQTRAAILSLLRDRIAS